MNLSDYELMPGYVVSTSDPDLLGRIKVGIPGAELKDNTQLDAMPWCYPISMTGTYQGFTKLEIGSKVWVLRNKIERLEMWYWPMFDMNPNTAAIANDYSNAEVLISRTVGSQNVYIYYTDKKGMMFQLGGSKINLTPGGAISISNAGGANVLLSNNFVYVNSKVVEYHGVREEPLTECLKQIYQCLCKINEGAKDKWATHPIHVSLKEDLDKLDKMVNAVPRVAWQSDRIAVQ
jgi:hypothetical protein